MAGASAGSWALRDPGKAGWRSAPALIAHAWLEACVCRKPPFCDSNLHSYRSDKKPKFSATWMPQGFARAVSSGHRKPLKASTSLSAVSRIKTAF